MSNSPSTHEAAASGDVDVVVVGSGFAGLYMLHRLRRSGWSAVVLEAADGIGGTWYWNRYPGARCDIQSLDYSYSFDPELDEEWEWSEKYATQPEILRYIHHVADKHDLQRDIRLRTKVAGATWDEPTKRWTIRTDEGAAITCRFFVMATGCLSVPKDIDIDGIERFTGEMYWTSRWPHEGVDFTGRRVGVVGTGSSGIQAIPIIARQAAALTVFQRTPTFSFPAHNGPISQAKAEQLRARRDEYREQARWSGTGVPDEEVPPSALAVDTDERHRRYEATWQRGELAAVYGAFGDTMTDPASNELMAGYVRDKIRSIVADAETAELLCPTDYPLGTKRPCLDTGYYETYNLPHVRLVDLRSTPLEAVTASGIATTQELIELDAIVFATGFDAITGAVVAMDIAGRDSQQLRDKWADGPETYLGLMTQGFPNLFTITGPQSPSVLSNMLVSIEQHVDWIGDCIDQLRTDGLDAIEPTATAEAAWVQHVNDWANITLYPLANSWYMGANIPGKPRVFLPYVGGVGRYRQVCADVVEQGYLGFRRYGDRELCNDGAVRRLQPDVEVLLEALAAADLPDVESLPVDDARALLIGLAAELPPGPEVGEVVDGELPGPAGPLAYRLYRPPAPGPHPIAVYFHGGGWVLGGATSNDAYCRDLCLRSGAVVISVDYRHAPEHRFPAAVEDAFASVRWVAEHPHELGVVPGKLAVCGFSAGGNLAAVACQIARDAGAPHISGQVLVAPVVDFDTSRPSYEDNADGYILTASLMQWFIEHYVDKADRKDSKAAPLCGSLAGLPTALVVTCEFDPLRDGGVAYAEALAAAGTEVRHLRGRGLLHTSITDDIGIIVSADDLRAGIAAELARMCG